MLEAPSILDYVNEEGSFLEGGGNGGGGGSTGSSSSLASYSSGASSSGNRSPGHHSFSSSSSSSSTTSVRGYYIFKDGIWPLWEDEYNVAGGCWTFRHTVSRNNGSSGGQPREMWKRLVSCLMSICFLFLNQAFFLPRFSPFPIRAWRPFWKQEKFAAPALLSARPPAAGPTSSPFGTTMPTTPSQS